MTVATLQGIQFLNLAYFGRPADPASLSAWPASGLSLEAIVLQFTGTAEYATNTVEPNSAVNPGGGRTFNDTNLINTFYQRLFGRLATSAEVAGWADALARGAVNYDYLGITILQAGLNLPTGTEMREVLIAKFDSNQLYTGILFNNPVDAAAYSTAAAIQDGIAFSSATTTTTPQTFAQTQTAVNQMVADSGAGAGQAFTLTTGIDNFAATSQNARFIGVGVGNNAAITAASTTLNAGDQISSSGNGATLDVTLSSTGGAATTYGQGFRAANIPNIRVAAFGADPSILDLASFDSRSATNLINSGSTAALTFTNVGTLAPLTVTNTTGATTVQYADAVVPTGNTTVAATINLAGASNSGNAVGVTLRGVTNGTDGAAVVTVNATGAQSDVNLNSGTNTLRTLTVNSAADNTVNITTAGNGLRSLTFSGAGTASADITTSTQNVTVVGGAGNDTVVFADAQLNANDSVALGEGTNVLGISVANAANGAAIQSAAGINAATGVSSLSLVGTAAANAGDTYFNGVSFTAVNPNVVVLNGFTAATGVQTYANASGAQAGSVFTATNVATTKTLVVSGDVSSRTGATGNAGGNDNATAGADGAAGANAFNASAALPLQTLNLALTPGSRDQTAIQISGGAAGNGGAGGNGAGAAAGGTGGAGVAGFGLTNLANISTLNLSTNGTTGTNSIIGGAAGTGGATGVAGANAGGGGGSSNAAQAFNNAAGLTLNISGSGDLTIAGGAAGTAGAAATATAFRALGFVNQVNVAGGTATGDINVQGSGALIDNGGTALTAGNVLTVGDVIVTGAGSDTIVGAGGGDVITTGAGSDDIAYITGNAGEIASGDVNPIAAELGALTNASLIDRITDFAAGTDDIRINTGGAFFSTNQLTFTAATTSTVGSFTGIANNAIADIDALLTAFNGAVTGGAVASTAAALQAYVFTTGTIAGGLANASNQTFLVINNSQAAINNGDFIANITGLTGTFSAGDITFGAV